MLRKFNPSEESYCTCPGSYALNFYVGCEFGCTYCYGRPFWRRRGLREGEILIKEKTPEKLKKTRKRNSPVLFNPISEPYQPVEKEAKLARKVEKILSQKGTPFIIQTKGTLIERDSDVLKESTCAVGFSISTLNENISSKIEPNAPSPLKRMNSLQYLSDRGVPCYLFCSPVIPEVNDDVRSLKNLFKEARNAGIEQVTLGILRVPKQTKISLPPLRKALKEIGERESKKEVEEIYLKKGELRAGYYYAPSSVREKIVRRGYEIAKRLGMEFASCRTGFGGYNTCTCDGRDLFIYPNKKLEEWTKRKNKS